MGLMVDASFWRHKRVFVTGHTGFKGSWLSIWLNSMGATVTGLSLDPSTTPSLFVEAGVGELVTSVIGDIRDVDAVRRTVAEAEPEIVLHLAAQPLVRASYVDPVETFSTNVMGTVSVLEASRACPSVRAVVNVTTDKCYENREWPWGYRENEPMGGHDPYSASKGCSELVTSAYQRSFFDTGDAVLASARAGNVIGGGDWAPDRLLPDILLAFADGRPVIIRNPHSTRPWQHVLEPLSGYLTLAQRLHEDGREYAEGWNFGPADADTRPVAWVVSELARQWGADARWETDDNEQPHEANFLKLDISKARLRLGWAPRWGLAEALDKTVDWYREWQSGSDVRALCQAQINDYTSTMREVDQ